MLFESVWLIRFTHTPHGPHVAWYSQKTRTYCGWKKSCTTLDGWNPLSTGAGFLPSTVFQPKLLTAAPVPVVRIGGGVTPLRLTLGLEKSRKPSDKDGSLAYGMLKHLKHILNVNGLCDCERCLFWESPQEHCRSRKPSVILDGMISSKVAKRSIVRKAESW